MEMKLQFFACQYTYISFRIHDGGRDQHAWLWAQPSYPFDHGGAFSYSSLIFVVITLKNNYAKNNALYIIQHNNSMDATTLSILWTTNVNAVVVFEGLNTWQELNTLSE